MNNITLFQYQKQEVRIVKAENGDPLWIAQDVCNVLGLSNTNRALHKLDLDEYLTLKVLTSGQNRNILCVTEPGLYNLIFRSNKPEAIKFRRWVTHDLLPQIRKSGFYSLTPQLDFPQKVKALGYAFKLAKMYEINALEQTKFAEHLVDNHYYDDNATLREWIKDWKLRGMMGKEKYKQYRELLEAGRKVEEKRNNIRLIKEDKEDD